MSKARQNFSFKSTLIIVLTLLISTSIALANEKEDKFLVIHLDGTQAELFYNLLEADELPNIASLTASGHRIKYGVSIFPGKTPLIVTRLKTGSEVSEGLPGWAYIDHQTKRKVNQVEVFLKMMSHIDRRSRSQFFLKFPILTELSGASLLNLDRLWETHDVLEYYWIYADSEGHSHGKEAYIKGLKKFDNYLGLAMTTGQLEGANIIFYADHGLTVDNVEVIRDKQLITKMLGKEVRYMFYPNIYLRNPKKKEQYAKKIVAETPVDLAIVRTSSEKITGYFLDGSFEIHESKGKYQYQSTNKDYFGYDELGYNQDYLDRYEWIELTRDHEFIATVPALFDLLQNPNAGDIVIALNSPKISWYKPNLKAHHAGLTSNDMRIPILFSGPAFEDLDPPDEMWLNDLFSEHLTMVNFNAKKHKEKHEISLKYPFEAEVVFSPAYRWKTGFTANEENVSPWIEFDVYSSFLTRFWVGGRYHDEKLSWRLNAEVFLNNFKARWLKNQNESGIYSVHWRFHENTEISISSKKQVGISIIF